MYRFWDVQAGWGVKRLLVLLNSFVLTLVELARKVFPKRAESIEDVAGQAMSVSTISTQGPVLLPNSPQPAPAERAAQEILVPARPSLMSGNPVSAVSSFRVVMRLFEGFTFGRLVPFRCRAPPVIAFFT
ncbi:hypothetical protein Acor_32440 [Acrocarpospora corrugata]|uniref:Uncharacterized protein n=1 Tax=Acrocarpospora corrugata TaxID=35763 RepID=A0A5M3VZ11_9ACTN|nr:hypothetical protein Acor_32440 [Acrocarpospora corrugata]